ncbi:hypothetical protein MUG78_17515 [Gordonia alkaliphila]|uniref:hypothetical protein n=1 Tax=Gordonia alkaliphila TaxID=1053547 RepID=UPI001FF60DD8|nr:hypothetical protein [Gordonia alkaliphila]MCK0441200.1 hypothetical protein [Gordonia alkaliphila]
MKAGDVGGGRPPNAARLHCQSLIDAGTWHPVSDRPVILQSNIALGWAARVADREQPSLHVRSWGLTFPTEMPATLIAWARFTTGLWAAVVEVALPTYNGAECVHATLWVPGDTIRPLP